MSFSSKSIARQSSAGAVVAQLNPQEVKQKRRERILTTLTRLNDRDTQKFAADELQIIIRELDAETFPILLNCLCSTGSDQKVYARRECARAMGSLTADTCPMRFMALQGTPLNKILGQLKKAMSDGDAGVREACSEALGVVGVGMAEADGQLLLGSTSNPVLRVIFDGLTVQSKETQACASQALLAIAPSIGTLEKDVLSLILKMLKSPAFLSASTLLNALAGCDPELHLPVGLVHNTVDYILPVLSQILGNGPQGGVATGTPNGGILGCLLHKDWQVRRSAADSVRALALLLGPDMESAEPVWDVASPASVCGRCIRALEACKFDKVKPVRDVIQDTLTILYELLEHGKADGGMDEWVQAVEERSNIKSNFQGANFVTSAPSSRPPSRGASTGVRNSLLIEGLRNNFVEDIMVAARSGKAAGLSGLGLHGHPGEGMDGGLRSSRGTDDGDMEMIDNSEVVNPTGDGAHTEFTDAAAVNGRPSSSHLRSLEAAFSPGMEPGYSPSRQEEGPGAADEEPMIQISAHEWGRVQADLATLYESHRQLMTMVLQLSEDSNTAVSTLQGRLAALEQAAVAIPAGLQPISTSHVPSPRPTSSNPFPAPSPSATPAFPTSHTPPANGVRTSGEGAPQTSGLRTSSSSLQDDGLNQSPISPITSPHHHIPPRRHSSPTVNASPYPSTNVTPRTPLEGGGYGTPLSSERNTSPWRIERMGTCDLDSAYAEALRSQGGSPTTELKLARLLQKTGPVWGELSQETAILLLQTFINMIEAGAMMPRIMPWLWRLADENCSPVDVAQAIKVKLLTALNNCQAGCNDDVQTQERVKLLRCTLITVWGLKSTPRASPINSPKSRSMRVRSSLEGLAMLQGELEDMQRNFRNGSRSPTSPQSTLSDDHEVHSPKYL